MKYTLTRKLLSALCALALILSLVPAAQAAGTPAVSDNALDNCYDFTAKVVKSHLYVNASGGLTRVEALTNKEIVVEDYSPSFALLSQRKIPGELEYYGGFFAGQSCNFFIFGQQNLSESDSVEVVRVVKYDKSWNRLGQASISGINTQRAFASGSVRCAESGGMLYIHTSHTMYKSSDGLNHQANMNIAVRQSDMQVTETDCGVGGYNNYVSHSFNQFIMADSLGNLLTLNQGDAYPRALVIHKLPATAGSESMRCTPSNPPANVQTERLDGNDGENQTNVWPGGLVETSSGYLMAYAQCKAEGDRIVLPLTQMKLAYISKADFRNGAAFQIRQLTANEKTSKVEGTPFLVPTGLSGGWILWNSVSNPAPDYIEVNEGLRYAAYSAGGAVGPVQKLNKAAPLSDCQPIYYNGKVVWYTTENSAPVFYCLDASGVTATPAGGSPAPVTGEAERVPTPLGSGAFSDVPASHWAYNDIAKAVSLGAVAGYSDGTFKPGDRVTIAEFSIMLERVFSPEKLEEYKAKPEYAGKPWYVPVCYLADHTFFHWVDTYILDDRKNDFKNVQEMPLDRFNMADMLYAVYLDEKNGFYYTELEYLKSQITDYDLSENPEKRWYWHKNEVFTCIHAGILTGLPDGSYGGEKPVTRAEACAVINRLYNVMYS